MYHMCIFWKECFFLLLFCKLSIFVHIYLLEFSWNTGKAFAYDVTCTK